MGRYVLKQRRRVNIYYRIESAITTSKKGRKRMCYQSLALPNQRTWAKTDGDDRKPTPWTEQSETCAARLTAATTTVQSASPYRDRAAWWQLHIRTSGPRDTKCADNVNLSCLKTILVSLQHPTKTVTIFTQHNQRYLKCTKPCIISFKKKAKFSVDNRFKVRKICSSPYTKH